MVGTLIGMCIGESLALERILAVSRPLAIMTTLASETSAPIAIKGTYPLDKCP